LKIKFETTKINDGKVLTDRKQEHLTWHNVFDCSQSRRHIGKSK